MLDAATKTEVACPINGKLCIDGTREDFPRAKSGAFVKCRWWQHLYGKDPQSEKMIDQWDCAVAWLPITTIETSQMSKQTAASVDKVANEVSGLNGRLGAQVRAIEAAGAMIRQGIEHGALHVMIPAKAENGENPSDKPTEAAP